jgi:MPBQ/MSBQ methyltransferase
VCSFGNTQGYQNKGFIQAKYDFIDRMLEFANINEASRPMKVLDVGCGIGGTARYLAKVSWFSCAAIGFCRLTTIVVVHQKFGPPDWHVTGITLSPQQVERAKQLATEQGVANADFHVMDALNMTFQVRCRRLRPRLDPSLSPHHFPQDSTFDVVWACESGEHMPDKARYIQEMTRVLKPGGTLVVATWCQRDSRTVPLTPAEKAELKFLYDEWTHPYFISIEEYEDIMRDTKQLDGIETADWTQQTLPSWRHSIWVGVWDPWPVIAKPSLWVKTLREILTLSRMHRAFESGLMRYGMFRARKVRGENPAAA